MQRKYEYAIIHIPFEALREATQKLSPNLPDKFVFSTTSKIPSNISIIEEEPPFPRASHQKCKSIKFPIEETNLHTKLSKQYHVQIDLYYREEG